MRLFQNFDVYPQYLRRLRVKAPAPTFTAIRQTFLDDRFSASHMLKPTLDGWPEAAFSLGGDEISQRDWATRRGMAAKVSMEDILLAQIEDHRTEIFYNHDPLRYGSDFVARLPASVRKTIAWRAAPSPGADFAGYDLVVCNFPRILDTYRERGWKTAYFAPAHDPAMDPFGASDDRPVDICFVGTYSRHHKRRRELIETIGKLEAHVSVSLNLQLSWVTRLADTPLGVVWPLAPHRRDGAVRRRDRGPVFGLDLYRASGNAKIVLNGAIDMAGDERGNMRCWEALGCGALMLSDRGRYPDGMDDGHTIVTYDSIDDLISRIGSLLAHADERIRIARAGYEMIRSRYSKDHQWMSFLDLAN